jgi:hypothetical protein
MVLASVSVWTGTGPSASSTGTRPSEAGARLGSGLVERVRTVLHRAGRFVADDDDAGAGRRGAGRRGAGEPQRRGLRAVAEELLAGAEVDGEVEQAVLVDEIVFDETFTGSADDRV